MAIFGQLKVSWRSSILLHPPLLVSEATSLIRHISYRTCISYPIASQELCKGKHWFQCRHASGVSGLSKAAKRLEKLGLGPDGKPLPVPNLKKIYPRMYKVLMVNQDGSTYTIRHSMLSNVWNQLITLEDKNDTGNTDDWAVVTLLQGVCFKGLQRYDEAESCFKAILQQAEQVQHDTYAIPAASLELGLLYIETGKLDEAHQILESTKANYKSYHLESRIHFRLHQGQCKLAQLKAKN